jgi:TolB-like protein/tetratricopeptide (TPR) repeat protein
MGTLDQASLKADLLDSWKEIAVFFGREVRTVQLWEREESLPVHRHVHKARGTVHAFRSELEAWKLSRHSCLSRTKNIISLVVIPFENQTLGRFPSSFAEGLAEDLVTNLGSIQSERIVVVARPPRMPHSGTHRDLQRWARSCKANYILSGSVRQSKDRVRVCTQLIRSTDMTYVWAAGFENPEADMITVQKDIASRITRCLIQALLLRANSPATSVGSAFEAYLRGRYFWNKRTAADLNRAVLYFEQAVSANPNCGLAYAGLADSYNLLGFYGELAPEEARCFARSAATRALQIDHGLAEAHASLAETLFGFDWDATAAEREFKRAIELDPAYPTAHHWYGNFLSALGRHEEAIAEVQQARQLDPLSLVINVWLGVVLHNASKYDKAIQQYERTLELDPNFPMAHAYLGLAYEQTRCFDLAIAAYEKALSLSGGHITIKAMLGHAYAVCGMAEQARQVLRELEALSGRTHFCLTNVALIYNGLGERQNALNCLERSYEERCPGMISLQTEPRLSSLRSEPRFQRLMRRVTTQVH